MRAAALQREIDRLGLDRVRVSARSCAPLLPAASLLYRPCAFLPCLCQCAVQPPSTGSAVPVIEAAASLARNTASAPISETCAKRLFGCDFSSTSLITLSRGMLCALA